jgi:hypothetical protein
MDADQRLNADFDPNAQDLGVDPAYLGKPTKGWVIFLWALLLIGFPTLGLFFFFKDAQNRIRGSAEPFVAQELPVVLSAGGMPRLEELATARLKPETVERDWARWQTEFGDLKTIDTIRSVDTLAGSADDEMVWQFARFEVRAQFTKKPGIVDIIAARRTMAPDWRIERIDVRDAN